MYLHIYTCIYISTHLLLALGDVVGVPAVYEGAPHVLAPPRHARLPRLLLLTRLRPLLGPALGLALSCQRWSAALSHVRIY